jgi:hypothetical protein
MRRIVLVAVAAFATAGAAVAAPRQEAMQPVTHYLAKQKLTPGFYRGRSVKYLDFGPIKLAPGNRLAPIWVVTNGVRGQRNIVDVVPGKAGYSPLWEVRTVTFKSGPRLLRSVAAVRAAQRAGELTVRRTSKVVNCPVVGFGQKQTLGFAKGKLIAYLDLGPVKLRAGNHVEAIVTFTNGTADQHNVVDTVPGDSDYTPLWRVRKATWKDGVTPRTLTSLAAVEAARSTGDLTVEQTSIVVNCPVV